MVADPLVFRDLAYVFAAAVLGGWLAWLTRQPLILGYVLGGILVGPFTPGPTVSDVHKFELLAEIGVILIDVFPGTGVLVPRFAAREMGGHRRWPAGHPAVGGAWAGGRLSAGVELATGRRSGRDHFRGQHHGVVTLPGRVRTTPVGTWPDHDRDHAGRGSGGSDAYHSAALPGQPERRQTSGSCHRDGEIGL